MAVVGQRIAVEGLQAGELAGLARCGEGEVHVRGVEGPEPIEQVGRVEAGRDRQIATTGLINGRLDGL